MFCHISVIKDDCCLVAYGGFYLPEHLQVSGGGKPKVDAEGPALSSLLMLRPFLFECVPSLISFSPLTNLSILMLNFTELMAADDCLN